MKQKPLSPHLFIYKPQITSITSIMHRVSGIALYFGLVFGVIYVAMNSYGRAPLDQASQFVCASCAVFSFIKNSFWCIFVFGFSFSLVYHILNGIKFLFWSIGKGFGLKASAINAYIIISLALVSSIFISYKVISLII